MALKITYFDSYDGTTRQVYGTVIGGASVDLTETSADLGTVPSGASVARIEAQEDCLISNNGANASATTALFLGAGSIVDIAVPRSGQFKGMIA